jgi:hypothetical protein
MDPDVRVGNYTLQDLSCKAKPPGTLARFGASFLLNPKNRPPYEGRFWLAMPWQFAE